MNTNRKYHINPETGIVSECNAKHKCPFGENAPHFPTQEQAQEYADLTNEKQELIDKINNGNYRFIDRLNVRKINKKLQLDEYDGLDTTELDNAIKEQNERKLKQEQEEQRQDIIAKKLSTIETLELPKKLLLNDVQRKSFWNKDKMFGKCFRGEVGERGAANGGASIYGAGVYSTTSKSYAKQYGNVRTVDYDELPNNPLCLKNSLSFSYLEQLVCEEYNIDKHSLYKYMNVDEFIKKFGYDGCTIGDKKELIIVKY